MTHDAIPFLLIARRYIHRGQNKQAWQAALVAARIAQARHDEWQRQACEHVVECVGELVR